MPSTVRRYGHILRMFSRQENIAHVVGFRFSRAEVRYISLPQLEWFGVVLCGKLRIRHSILQAGIPLPDSLFHLAAILVQEKFVDLASLYAYVSIAALSVASTLQTQ